MCEMILQDLQKEKEILWINPDRTECFCDDYFREKYHISASDIEDAEARLARFAPFIKKVFPETAASGGIIESVLKPIPQMQKRLNEQQQCTIDGNLLLKQDSHLAIAGSVKARGGIYEVLCHTEQLAVSEPCTPEHSHIVHLYEVYCQA